jgi:thiol-disulfide isomerase/thioredoxin
MKRVLKFSANRCGACKRYEKTFEAAKRDLPQFEFVSYDEELNVDKFEEYCIENLPTTIVVSEDGLFRREGDMELADLFKLILLEKL